ncbi:MAG: flagellar biosynthesis anti-sigma factor FlgM [Candidatus Wallbacteria bacterium]|nr:flagellar biosynthesis anti-sigma factor FlgM [Candidatus Wallbacteria bacterium]
MAKISGISGGVIDSTPKKIKQTKSDEFKKIIDQKLAESGKKTAKSEADKTTKKIELPADAKKALTETPDVREEKIQKIKEQIANGTYKVDARDVAGAMLKKGFKP